MRREQIAFCVLISLFTVLACCPAWAQTGQTNSDLSEISKRVEETSADERDLAKLTELAAKSPRDANLHYLLGHYLENKGFEQLALDSYATAIQCDANFKLAHYRRCVLLLRINDVEPAMPEVRLCEQLFADDGDKLFLIGQSLEQVGRHDDAKRLFHKSTMAGHQDQGHGLVLAKIKFHQLKFDEALEAVDWDLKSNSKDPRASMFKAEILLRLKREEEAMTWFLHAAKSGPCDQNTAAIVSRKFVERKRYNDALTAALFDLLCPQKDAAAMEKSKSNVLDLILKVGDKESQSIINAISPDIERLRRCRHFRLALGDIYDRLNRPLLAMAQYQLAIHDCPSQFTDDVILGRGYFRLGRDYESVYRNHREAFDLYRRAQVVAPNDPEIAANYSRLEHRMKLRKNDVAAHIKDAWYSFWKMVWPPAQPH